MSTNIEWVKNKDGTKGESWNPWQGCHKISTGCRECYMFRDKKRFGQNPNKVIRSSAKTFEAPLKWKESKRIFVCSWSDFFIDEADGWRQEALEIMGKCSHHTFLLLTKRPQNMLKAFKDVGTPDNIWLGVSVENQKTADERIPILLDIPAKVRFVSIEPMLGAVDVTNFLGNQDAEQDTSAHAIWRGEIPGIDWIIAGCESGPGARPCNPDWARHLRDQCVEAGVPFFLKQLSQDGKIIKMPFLDGGKWDQLPGSIVSKKETVHEDASKVEKPTYREGDLDKFIGCAPGLTEGLSAREYIDNIHHNQEASDEKTTET